MSREEQWSELQRDETTIRTSGGRGSSTKRASEWLERWLTNRISLKSADDAIVSGAIDSNYNESNYG